MDTTTRLRCEGELGLRPEAAIDHEKLLQFASVYVGDEFRNDLKTILVLNSSDNIPATDSLFGLHFKGNFPAQLAQILGDRFNFISVLFGNKNARLNYLQPDVVLNNIINAEAMSIESDTKDVLSALADSFGVPVINHPMKAALTTRQRVAFFLKDLPNVVIPKMMRLKRRTPMR